MDFNSIDSIIGGFDKILSLSSAGPPPTIPTPLIMVGAPSRPGLSAIKIATKIIGRKAEAGLPVGALPSGTNNPDELMERIRVEEIIKAIQEDALVSVAIPPGLTITGAGANAGGPVAITGSSILPFRAYGVIQ